MIVLISTGHPAQVHNFRPLKEALEEKGHKVYWIATEKDLSKNLLNHYDIEYRLIKKPKRNYFHKAYTLFYNTLIGIRYIRKVKIDIILSRVSPYLSLAGLFTNTPHIALADT